MTNNVATTSTQTAAVAEPGAQVAPKAASSKNGATRKKGAPHGQKRAQAGKPPAKPKTGKRGRQSKAAGEKPIPREGTAKAKVIAMIRRRGGATLDEICKVTGWQKHTTRGFISTLHKKGGPEVVSGRRESDKARVYEAK